MGNDYEYNHQIELEIDIGGVVKSVSFEVSHTWDNQIQLTSRGSVAYCKRNNGKCWPTELIITVMTKLGRSLDESFPNRKKMPTWQLATTAKRLNKTYPIRGWWLLDMDKHESMHNGRY